LLCARDCRYFDATSGMNSPKTTGSALDQPPSTRRYVRQNPMSGLYVQERADAAGVGFRRQGLEFDPGRTWRRRLENIVSARKHAGR